MSSSLLEHMLLHALLAQDRLAWPIACLCTHPARTSSRLACTLTMTTRHLGLLMLHAQLLLQVMCQGKDNKLNDNTGVMACSDLPVSTRWQMRM